MNKQYTTPEVNISNVNPSTIICTSVSFGNGETSIMHARKHVEQEGSLGAGNTHTSNNSFNLTF